MNLELTNRQKELARDVAEFAQAEVRPHAKAIDLGERNASAVVAAVAKKGWLNTADDLTDLCVLIEGLARESSTVASLVAMDLLTVIEPLSRWGEEDSLLQDLRAGKTLGACCMSWPQEGAASQNWRAGDLSVEFEATDEGYRLTGAVNSVVGLRFADVILVAAKDASSPSAAALFALSCVDGVSIQACDASVGNVGDGRGDLQLDGHAVASSAKLVSSSDDGDFLEFLTALSSVAAAAVSVGVGRAGFETALETLTARDGGPESSPQSSQFYVADMSTDVDAARLLTWKAALALRSRRRAGVEASQAKFFATEAAQRATDLSLQIAGAKGYERGSEMERQFRDARALELLSGAKESHKRAIADRLIDES